MSTLPVFVLLGLWFSAHQVKITRKKSEFGELIATYEIPITIGNTSLLLNLFYSFFLAYQLLKLNHGAFDIDSAIAFAGGILFIVKFYYFDRKQKFLIFEEGFVTPIGPTFWGTGCWGWYEVNDYYMSGRKKQNFVIEVNDYTFGIPTVKNIRISSKQIELVNALREKLNEKTNLKI
jgi:hypothetical protein